MEAGLVEGLYKPRDSPLLGSILQRDPVMISVTKLWLAGNQRMEKNRETTIFLGVLS